MPKPSKNHDAHAGLLTFMLLNDAPDWINNPREWIDKSFLTYISQDVASNKANGALISEIFEKNFGKPNKKSEAKSEMQSIVAKIKADKNLPKKIWAIAYYRQKIIKAKTKKIEIASEIRALLVKYFPEDEPKGKSAQTGKIPTVATIAKEWLKEEAGRTKPINEVKGN